MVRRQPIVTVAKSHKPNDLTRKQLRKQAVCDVVLDKMYSSGKTSTAGFGPLLFESEPRMNIMNEKLLSGRYYHLFIVILLIYFFIVSGTSLFTNSASHFN
jgi:hypothetical protein